MLMLWYKNYSHPVPLADKGSITATLINWQNNKFIMEQFQLFSYYHILQSSFVFCIFHCKFDWKLNNFFINCWCHSLLPFQKLSFGNAISVTQTWNSSLYSNKAFLSFFVISSFLSIIWTIRETFAHFVVRNNFKIFHCNMVMIFIHKGLKILDPMTLFKV